MSNRTNVTMLINLVTTENCYDIEDIEKLWADGKVDEDASWEYQTARCEACGYLYFVHMSCDIDGSTGICLECPED